MLGNQHALGVGADSSASSSLWLFHIESMVPSLSVRLFRGGSSDINNSNSIDTSEMVQISIQILAVLATVITVIK